MDLMTEIRTKLFGTSVYTKEDGVDFDDQELVMNNITSLCTAMIFEDLDETGLSEAVQLLDNLEAFDAQARKEILSQSEDSGSTVSDFVNEHFNDYGDEIEAEIFEKLKINSQNNKAFLEGMELGGVVVYYDAIKGICITLDYNLIWEAGSPFTDQILAASFNKDGKFLSIAHES